ncbi:hypothetical protein TNCV_1563941 [Trichonephila clavipes]|nr:hypothetical protein TNCV_1563941 [Trichonephila clavipes]
MGTLPSSRRGKCVTLFGGVRDTPRNSSACKQQQGRYTNYCCNPYGKAAPHLDMSQEGFCLSPPCGWERRSQFSSCLESDAGAVFC